LQHYFHWFSQQPGADGAAAKLNDLAEQSGGSEFGAAEFRFIAGRLFDADDGEPAAAGRDNGVQTAAVEQHRVGSSVLMQAKDNVYWAEIGIYTFVSFFLLMAVLSFTTIFLIYCAKRFACRYLLYVLWVLYGLLGVVFFAASGFLIIATFTAYDGCTAYHQITTDSVTLQSLSFYNTSQFAQSLDSCFFPIVGSTDSVFQDFTQQTTFTRLKNLQTLYGEAVPSSSFSTVADSIQEALNNFAINPNTVLLANATTSQNPQAALTAANNYAANGGGQTCNAVNDLFVYNPVNCYPRTLDQVSPSLLSPRALHPASCCVSPAPPSWLAVSPALRQTTALQTSESTRPISML
jgi:hypothetical protein